MTKDPGKAPSPDRLSALLKPQTSEKERAARRSKRSDGDYQRAVGEFVHREVIYCVSGLVFQIGRESDDWFHLFVQDDWETAVREAVPDMPRGKSFWNFSGKITVRSVRTAMPQHYRAPVCGTSKARLLGWILAIPTTLSRSAMKSMNTGSCRNGWPGNLNSGARSSSVIFTV